MAVDLYQHRTKYLAWRERKEQQLVSRPDATMAAILDYLRDMEMGVNVARAVKRGPRSYARLNTLGYRLPKLSRLLNGHSDTNGLLELTQEQVHLLFEKMRNGQIRKPNGERYRSTSDYIKDLRAFWHWHMRVQKKRGLLVSDICEELDDWKAKPAWVYLSEADVRRLCRHAKFKYQAMMLFMFDAGLRSPTELANVKMEHLTPNCDELVVDDASSKTFGRRIKLLLCSDILREYIQEQGIRPEDHLFPICPRVVNRYLKRLASRLLGDGQSPGGEYYDRLTMYDFRHSSACFWLPRYKSESALKYRFGWRRSQMIEYYTEFLGMKDTITEDDLLVGGQRTEVETRLDRAECQKRLLEEELASMRREMDTLVGAVKGIAEKAGWQDPVSPP